MGSGRSLQSSGIVCVCVCVCFIKAYQLDLFPSRLLNLNLDFPCGSDVKVSAYNACRRPRFIPWVRKIAWRRKWQPTPVHLPGESHGWRSLVGYSSWGRKESDRTEGLHFHFHFQLKGGVADNIRTCTPLISSRVSFLMSSSGAFCLALGGLCYGEY